MRGDQSDFIKRLRLTLPGGWFEDTPPVLCGLLAGLGAAWKGLYDLLVAVRAEARLSSVTDRFLDLACLDFFGSGIARRSGEGDNALRARLQQALHRLRGTRGALIDAALVAGYQATVFEPARPADTGAYNVPASLAWNVAGGWGSLQMPLECLVTVQALVAVSDPAAEVAVALPAGGIAWMRILR